jgi:hypothetical protein
MSEAGEPDPWDRVQIEQTQQRLRESILKAQELLVRTEAMISELSALLHRSDAVPAQAAVSDDEREGLD